jgi:hypothetical protein
MTSPSSHATSSTPRISSSTPTAPLSWEWGILSHCCHLHHPRRACVVLSMAKSMSTLASKLCVLLYQPQSAPVRIFFIFSHILNTKTKKFHKFISGVLFVQIYQISYPSNRFNMQNTFTSLVPKFSWNKLFECQMWKLSNFCITLNP